MEMNSNEKKLMRVLFEGLHGARSFFYIDLTDDKVLASYVKNPDSQELCRVKKSDELLSALMSRFNDEDVAKGINDKFCNESLLKAYSEGRKDIAHEVEMVINGTRVSLSLTAHISIDASSGHICCTLYVIDVAKEHDMRDELDDLTRLTSALSIEYTTVILIDLDADEMEIKKADPNVNASQISRLGINSFSAFADLYISRFVLPKYLDEMREKMDVSYFRKQFEERGFDRISMRYEVYPNKVGQRHFEINVVSIDEENGHWAVLGVRCIDSLVENEERDRKVLADALAAAEHANKANSVFLNNMSHDIRTPMNAILGFTELASKHLEDTPVVREYLTKIKTSSQHLLSLINQVLDMSRIESGHVQLDENETNVSEIIDQVKTIVMAGVKEKHQQLTVDISDVRHDSILADKVRLSQVLINIVSNSVKYTPDGGCISVRVGEKESQRPGFVAFEFHVEDNGIGMSEDFQQYVFDSFSREKTATNSGVQGTGLGMAITKRIVDMMGGEISVNSKQGKGTEFVVLIECKVLSEKHDELAMTQNAVSFRGRRALLVEDNELNQEIACTLLEEIGLTVEVAANGLLGLNRIKEVEAGWFDVVFMDVQMPVMDGYEATRQIRALDDTEKAIVPIVAMTANAFEEDRLLGEAAGMTAYLTKPIDISLIVKELTKIL